MTADLELTARQAAKALRDWTWRQPETKAGGRGGTHIGVGVLRCALCGGTLVGSDMATGWYASIALYSCADSDCEQTGVPVTEVDGELETFTRKRLAEPAVVARWRAAYLAELDDRIAEARPVLPWCRDQRRRRQLSRRLALFDGSARCVSSSMGNLFFFGAELADVVYERVRTAGESKQGRSIRELTQAAAEWRTLWRDIHGVARRDVRRVLGRRHLKEIYDEWDRLQERLWDLLNETDWQYPYPARLPLQDRAMDQKWSQSPGVMARQRRSLLAYALGDDQLVVAATKAAGSRVRVDAPASDDAEQS
ncbi:hypothetical protein ACIBQX_48875 [Nonomuraea sp. NPDC049714]|uniref:hypothetical protein n=1 Tax=Nonomuraea sp. NPDC049714 TaxID=3364357 RepID=UPI0037965226